MQATGREARGMKMAMGQGTATASSSKQQKAGDRSSRDGGHAQLNGKALVSNATHHTAKLSNNCHAQLGEAMQSGAKPSGAKQSVTSKAKQS